MGDIWQKLESCEIFQWISHRRYEILHQTTIQTWSWLFNHSCMIKYLKILGGPWNYCRKDIDKKSKIGKNKILILSIVRMLSITLLKISSIATRPNLKKLFVSNHLHHEKMSLRRSVKLFLTLFKLNITFYVKCSLHHNCSINLNWNNTQIYSSSKPLHNVASSVFWFVNFCFLPFLCRTSVQKWKKNKKMNKNKVTNVKSWFSLPQCMKKQILFL